MDEHQLVLKRRQSVIDHNFGPVAEHPEVEPEDTSVAFRLVECLGISRKNNLVEEIAELAET